MGREKVQANYKLKALIFLLLAHFWNCIAWQNFAVTADYKALLLCTRKKRGEAFILGEQGKGVEACLYCTVMRVST